MASTTSSPEFAPLCTVSALPQTLLRAFKEEGHARQFLAGHLRFGLLQYYRTTEGCRGDDAEGRASIRWDLESEYPDRKNVTYTGTSLNPYYVLCTFHPTVCGDHIARFGSIVVRIDEPLKLLERICDAWKNDRRSSSDAFIVPVLYNKDDLVPPPAYFLAPPCLVYAQKPAKYAKDSEYRYVLCCQVGTPEDPFLTLNLGSCDDICSLL